jgi:hypothetical protein
MGGNEGPHVIICGCVYDIIYTETLDNDALGESHLMEGVIKIRGTLSEEGRKQVLYHEIVHLALGHTGVGHMLKPKQEEAVCDAVGLALAGMILGEAQQDDNVG